MEPLDVMERLVSDKIGDDLRKIEELSIIANDPLGYAVYLYFLLKNERRSVVIDNLIDWMNSWVENIIIERNFSRFVDVEVASAFFAFFSLRTFGRLTVQVEVKKLTQLASEHVQDDRFFGAFTLSSIMVLALSDFQRETENYSNLLTLIQNQATEKHVVNDAKNIVVTSILFERLQSEVYLRRIVDYCYDRMLENTIPSHDELYYAYVLWKFKDLRGRKEDIQRIRKFTMTSINNAKKLIEKEVVDESVEEFYGTDLQRVTSRVNVSKIWLGIFLDLLIDFSKGTIRVSKEELTRKDVPFWIRSGSLISAIIFLINIPVLWIGFQWNIIRRAPIDLSMLTLNSAIPLLSQFFINSFFFFLVVFLSVTSASLFWDVVFESSGNPEVIKRNLKMRLSKHLIYEIIVPLSLGLLGALFGT